MINDPRGFHRSDQDDVCSYQIKKINNSLSANPQKFVFLCIMERDGAHRRVLHRGTCYD